MRTSKKTPGASCKHLLATWLYRRALEQVSILPSEPTTAPPMPHTKPARAAMPPLPEAAFSITVKGTMSGHEVLLTARGQTWEAFQANVAAVRGLLDTPAVPAAANPASAAPAPETPTCEWHGAMKASTKAPGTWYCTKKKADGSYCTSRWPQKGA
jgi:hypothetical protein